MLERLTPALEAQQAANAAELFVQRHREKIAQAQAQDLDHKTKHQLKNKIYAAGGRFMASHGFSTEYMQILWEKMQVNNDI